MRNDLKMEAFVNPVVKEAMDAFQAGEEEKWYDQFVKEVTLYDDGIKRDFHSFSKDSLKHERFVTIDKIEDKGRSLYGSYHSKEWGDFKAYFKFYINAEGKIERLDIGKSEY